MKFPSMTTPSLAVVYLNNKAVGLMGDPQPIVSKIVAAGGTNPDTVQVLRAASATDMKGTPVSLDAVIDRTAQPTIPIYLTSKPKAAPAQVPSGEAPGLGDAAPTADELRPRPLASPPARDDFDGPLPRSPPLHRAPSPAGPDAEWRV